MVGGINSADIHMINTIATNGGGISDDLFKTPFFQHDPEGILGIFVVVKIEIPAYNSWFCIGGIEIEIPGEFSFEMVGCKIEVHEELAFGLKGFKLEVPGKLAFELEGF